VKVAQAHFEVGMPLSMGQLLSIPAILFGVWMLGRAWQQGAHADRT
jgi:prolipoprotein diacylglyceryltransferase